jgi:DNA polymerase-3 subunit alpha
MEQIERLNIEKELIGFYFSGHPMDDYKKEWEQFVKLDLSDIDTASEGDYTLIGILKTLKPYTTKSGKAMAFATFSDYRGEIDLTFFEETWNMYRDTITEGDIIALKGKLDKKRGKPNLLVGSILDSKRIKIKENILEYCSPESGPQSAWAAADNSTVNLKPLDNYKEAWEQFTTLNLSKLEQGTKDTEYTLIGILIRLNPIIAKKNNKPMAFGSLADYRGKIDLVFFPNTWEIHQDIIEENHCIAVKGKLDKSRSKLSFKVSSVLEIGKLRRKAAKNVPNVKTEEHLMETARDEEPIPKQSEVPKVREVHIRLKAGAAENEEILYPLRDYLLENPGLCPIYIHVPDPPGETVILSANKTNAAAMDTLSSHAPIAESWLQ